MVSESKPCSPVYIPPEFIEAFRKKALELHNKYRRIHGVLPLSSNSLYLRSIAEQYSNQLASGFEIKHNPELKSLQIGENLSLFMSPNLHDLNEADFEYYAGRSVDAWYNEINFYDFDKAEFSHETGHFTQMIWKDTTVVEFAVGLTNICDERGRYYLYIVANYSKPGNYKNRFKKNVLPPLFKYDPIYRPNTYEINDSERNNINKHLIIENRYAKDLARNSKNIQKSKSKVEFQIDRNKSNYLFALNNGLSQSNNNLIKKTKSFANLLNDYNDFDKEEKVNKNLIRKSKSDAVIGNYQFNYLTTSNSSNLTDSKKDSTINSTNSNSNGKSTDAEMCRLSQKVDEKIKSYNKLNQNISQVIKRYLKKNIKTKKNDERKQCQKKSNSITKLSDAVIQLNRKDVLHNSFVSYCQRFFLTKLNELNRKYLKNY